MHYFALLSWGMHISLTLALSGKDARTGRVCDRGGGARLRLRSYILISNHGGGGYFRSGEMGHSVVTRENSLSILLVYQICTALRIYASSHTYKRTTAQREPQDDVPGLQSVFVSIPKNGRFKGLRAPKLRRSVDNTTTSSSNTNLSILMLC